MNVKLACPDAERLRQLVEGVLSAAEQTEWTRHIDQCDECQRELDRRASQGGGADTAPHLKTVATEHEPALAQAIDRLKASPTGAESCADDSLDFLTPPQGAGSIGQFGEYDVLKVIGRGGMGIVLLAFDRTLGCRVALKVLSPRLATSENARRRFLREARAAAGIHHENVIAIHALAEANGLPYIVMPYLPGGSLEDLLARSPVLPIREILRIGIAVASGLAAAHQQGIVHRDIKPANILIDREMRQVRITDFGLARAVDDTKITQADVVPGTPEYMSPEQARGDSFDARTDLFSLGSVLFRMATGRVPFPGDSTMGVLRAVLEDTPPPVHELNQDVPVWLSGVIDKLHAKRPADRFASADEAATLLAQCLEHLERPSAVALPSELARMATRRRSQPSMPRIAIFTCAMLCFAIVLLEFAGVIQLRETIRYRADRGTVVIEVEDPATQVSIDGKGVSINQDGVGEIRLHSGSYELQASKLGAPTTRQLVTVTRGGKQVVRVNLELPRPVNFLNNPGFEEAIDERGEVAAYWLAIPGTGGDQPLGECERDTSEKFAGTASARISRQQFTLAECGFLQNVVNVQPGDVMRLAAHVRSLDLNGQAFAVLRFKDVAGNLLHEFRTSPASESSDWQEHSVDVTVPQMAQHAVLAIVIRGKGTAWFDDVRLESSDTEIRRPIARPAVATTEPGTNLIQFGGFDGDGANVLAAWRPAGQGLPGLTIRLDNEVKRSGSAAAHAANRGPLGDVFGWRQDITERLPIGQLLRLTGYVKTVDSQFAGVSVQLLDAHGRLIGLPTTQGKIDLSGTRDWTRFELRFRVPSGTADLAVLAMISGAGEAWFDDFELIVESEEKRKGEE